jgi:cell division protease FtsH
MVYYNISIILFYLSLFKNIIFDVNSLRISPIHNKIFVNNLNTNPFGKKYYEQYLKHKYYNNTNTNTNTNNFPKMDRFLKKKYYLTNPEIMKKMKRLNSKNTTIQNDSILNNNNMDDNIVTNTTINKPEIRIILNKSQFLQSLGINIKNIKEQDDDDDDDRNGDFEEDDETGRKRYIERKNSKSKNFEIIEKSNVFFKDVGGYENVKDELVQCVDILKNYQKYLKYNVRIPKGLILEGPPGTGKTLLAKALAGEAECSFISVSGSDFQEKYVGVGSARIKELFGLAKKNIPCIIFIDEFDAVGRKRSSDGESSSNERDSTLNSLLVELDGFKNNTGVFLVAATNRIDLLDNALIRPGRIDKKIFIGLPDSYTREAIINIHIKGKPFSDSIGLSELVEVTEGFSGAQIENLLNEAMLNALRANNTEFCYKDFDFVMNKMMAGWQPVEHEFTSDIIDHIALHEMGHAIVGFLSKYHSKMSKVVINLSSPKTPGYTVFKGSTSNIYTREALFEHLMILLSGRIAEEVFYNVSVTTGAINDFEEALKLAEKMVIYYGMGNNIIYPSSSEKYKEMIDNDVINLINSAYQFAEIIILNCKDLIYETSEILKRDKILKADKISELINIKYKYLLDFKIDFESINFRE